MSTTTRTNTDGIISASDITNTATEDRTARPQPSVPTSAAKASSTIAEAKATADAAPETTISNGPAARNRNDPALGQRMDQAKRLAESETARLTDKPDDVVQAEQSAKDAIRAVAPSASLRSTSGSLSMIGIAALGFAFYGALAFGIAAIFSATVRRVWSDDWLWILVAFALVGLFTALMQWLDDRLRQASEEAARKVFVMVAIPTITAAIMGLIAFGSTQYLALAAQLIIIPVTALLPAVTYFLFLTTRRPSILNEFIGNLGRLGLLARRSAPQSKGEPREESNAERAARVESYFQRFEAIYGALRFESGTERLTRTDFVGRLTELVETPNATLRLPQAAIFIGDIFNANLVIPIGLVTILATLGWLLVLQPFFDTTGLTVAVVTPKLTPENFAFLGAYFFGLQMLFRRFVRRDLSPNAYFAFANRIIIAMIGIWLVSAVYPVFPEQAQAPVTTASAETSGSVPVKSATPDGPAGGAVTAPPIDGAKKIEAPGGTKDGAAATTTSYRTAIILLLAFTIGVFPRVVWQFISAAVTRLLYVKLVIPSVEAAQPLYELDGLTVWHETRLEEEDVENVPNMASVDVVEVMLHTQIPMERLIGWIDQAILLTVLGVVGKDIHDKLRKIGLRTATQVVGVASTSGDGPKLLKETLGADQVATLVLALQKEANFERVRAWRDV